jgi:hypothetical protein
MLRPIRRSTRLLTGAAFAVVTLALIWPATIVAAPPTTGGSTAKADRTPLTASRGVKPFDSGKGTRPSKPFKEFVGARPGSSADTSASSGPAPLAPVAPSSALAAPQSVLATSSGAPAATSFGAWEGIDQATSGKEPADPWVAAGPDDIVQTVNSRLRFTNREAFPTAPDVDAFDFFDLNNVDIEGTHYNIHGYGDPRWHYDTTHGRWIGLVSGWHCDVDGEFEPDPDSTGFVFGAISLTGDPTGAYYQFIVAYVGFLADYPMLGTASDTFTISANEYAMTDNPERACTSGALPDGASLSTFNWADMLVYPAFPLSEYYLFLDETYTYFSPRPAFAPQASANVIFGVIEKSASELSTASNVLYFTITGLVNATLDGTTVSLLDLTEAGVIPWWLDPPTPQQPGGGLPAGIVDRRPTDALWQDNILTFTSTGPCDPVGGGSENRDCARVTQVDTSTAPPTRVQDMLIGTTGKDTWYPGIGQSQSGTLHVVYTESSSTQGMSSFDRYQLPSDAKHTLSNPTLIISGGATHYIGTKWGQYTGVAQDPRDRNAVWQGNQATKSDGTWATRVSELQTAGSTFIPITPTRVLDSRFGVGLSGFFTSNLSRSVQIAGLPGIPSAAVAITGNLTVTQQSSAGFLAITPTPNNNPSTSTLNFPLGDTRANNVTSPLGTDGRASIVYRTSTAGQHAHVILDVTGYFVDSVSSAVSTYKTMAPTRILDTRAASQVGPYNTPFVDGAVRSWPVRALLPGAPANAIAVTGNVTVAEQTSRGLVAIGPTVSVNPETSTLNFPLGDNRANGVTVKLATDGSLSAVFRGATSSSTAHVIFDVTGFYVQDLTGARFVALTPGRRMDTRFPAPPGGLSGPFSVNVPRTLTVAPYQGVPNNATAITGNLTVVGQTRGGFVTMTTDPNSNTSTINFPVGDTRANGVTGPLTASGDEIFVYRATASGTTHLILDLTGYFR